MFIRVNMSSRLSKKDNPGSGELMDCSAKYLKSLVGAPGFEPGPPAPKAGVISLGSPSFSISVLKIKELEKYLIVARCTEMWLRMHGVPRIFPIAK